MLMGYREADERSDALVMVLNNLICMMDIVKGRICVDVSGPALIVAEHSKYLVYLPFVPCVLVAQL